MVTEPEEEELELGAEGGVAEEVVEGVEVPRVELDVDGAGADDPDEVGHEEGQEDGVGVPGALGDGGVLVLGEDLPVEEVGRCCSSW